MGDKTGIMWCNAIPVEARDVHGFAGYRVGADGSVWSAWRHNGHQARALGALWRRMRPSPDGDGYLGVNLFCGGKPRRRKVAALVLEAFVGPRPAGMQTCHNDGDNQNNTVGNLRWDTARANQHDRRKHCTDQRGERGGNARLTETLVRAIKGALVTGAQCKRLAAFYGVAPSTISGIKSGRLWGWIDG